MFLRLFITIVLLSLSGIAMTYEEPKYDVIEKSDAFELRACKPVIVAESFVDGSMDEATRGFTIVSKSISRNDPPHWVKVGTVSLGGGC